MFLHKRSLVNNWWSAWNKVEIKRKVLKLCFWIQICYINCTICLYVYKTLYVTINIDKIIMFPQDMNSFEIYETTLISILRWSIHLFWDTYTLTQFPKIEHYINSTRRPIIEGNNDNKLFLLDIFQYKMRSTSIDITK